MFSRVGTLVNVKADQEYIQIGIRSHGKGIFHKDSVLGEELGRKRVFWVVPNVFVVNIVFAWERAIAKTTEHERGLIASHRFPMYMPNTSKIDLDFAVYYFLTNRGVRLLKHASPGGAGRNKTLGQTEFSKAVLHIPSLSTQKKIGALLTLIDRRIDLQRRKVELLKDYDRRILRSVFGGSKLPSCPLCSIVNVTMGQSPQSNNYTFDEKEMLLIQGNADIIEGVIVPRIYTKQITKTCKRGDIIMSVRAPVGDVAVTDYDACIGRGVCSIDGTVELYHYLRYCKEWNIWRKYSQGSTVDSVNREVINDLSIPANSVINSMMPEMLTMLQELIIKDSKKLKRLEMFKMGLLQNLFV